MSTIDRSQLTRGVHLLVRIGVSVVALNFASNTSAHEMPEFFSATRAELDVGKTGDETIASWDLDGWMGSDLNRLAWKTEGDVVDNKVDEAEAQLLYSRYLAPFWDFQIGVRHDIDPRSHNYLAAGMHGLAPYGFEVDAFAFVRSDGKLFARTNFEYELLFTNRFIVSPFVFGDWAASSSAENNIKGGLYSLEFGINARYEFARTFAPYVEVARVKHFTVDTPDGDAHVDEDTHYSIVRAGIRLLF